jgi:D-inositol-3-phosphate glycosyltransferase
MNAKSNQVESNSASGEKRIAMALLTGGSDKPYVFGITTVLTAMGVAIDMIGSDELDCPEFRSNPLVNFLNLRGSQKTDASRLSKVLRILEYYAKLIGYAAAAKPKIFHILWNNKFEYFDRTLLMLYYRLLGKRVVFTAHNVNSRKRDRSDSWLNRFTLRIQYLLSNHIFVHTEKMKQELLEEFGINDAKVTVIPFGINNAVPHTELTASEAKQRLGVRPDEKTILFFGRITPYKGAEYLIAAFRQVMAKSKDYRLNRCEEYWAPINEDIRKEVENGQILLRADFIPDSETEVYFKGSDVLVLPYRQIYQSGVLFLSHSFGLPVLAADVGSLKDDIVEGMNGLVFASENPADLARAIEQYFASDVYADLDNRRQGIKNYSNERHSWEVVGKITTDLYANLLRMNSSGKYANRDASTSVDVKASS